MIVTIKLAYKQALLTGRIYQQPLLPRDSSHGFHLPGEELTIFQLYVRPLSEDQWMAFQSHEQIYRDRLNTKRQRDKHVVSSGDPGKWIKLAALLNGIFFKNGVFTAESHNSRPFGFQFLKYAARVLKKFPATQSYPEDVTSASVSDWIREQLCYLRETVLPSLRTGATRSQRNRKVSRNKLAYLWQYRRSKAIQVILNNSEYPDPPPCPSDITAIQTYYDSKCLNQRFNEDLPSPPWCLNVPPPKPTFFPKTTHFTQQEVETVLKNLPNNKASGKDGVTYETFKNMQSHKILTTVFNVCLENKRIPDSWKGALIHRIPKKDNIPDDPSTWRDISLLPTIYKVFMKCILARVLPWLVEADILFTKQKAYINRQGMNEHVFCLKTGIDDFKHESCRLYSVFLDFRDAFGTLSHDVMIRSLEEIQLPQLFIDIVKDVYRGSFIEVICGEQLTHPTSLQIGIKTGCPWSAINFIIAINQWLKWMCQCAPPGVISPIPVQGYADDVLMVSREECVVKNMLARTDAFLEWSGLEIKDTKCAVLYERRSGGNRWYHSKSDKCPVFTVATKPIRVYSLHETYAYLGHKINIAGEWKEQVNIILSEFTSKLDLIDKCPLPLTMKLEAIRQVALSKVQHLFSNVHIQQKVLSEMDNKTVSLV